MIGRVLVAMIVLVAAAGGAAAKDLVVLCAGAVKPALSVLEPAWIARGGPGLQVTYAPAGDLLRRIAAGERADLLILPAESMAIVERQGLVTAGSRRDLGTVGIGVAVREGAALPDLSSEDGLRRALLEARSLTYMDPDRGTSGRYVDEVVLVRLGIRDAVRAKTLLGEGGMIAEKVARGEVEMALQQMTELIPVAGIRIAGPLPPTLQKTTVYAGVLMARSEAPGAAAELLAFLASGEGRAAFASQGFAPP